MSPEAVDYLAKAERFLERANQQMTAAQWQDAGRNAYSAALTAARAVIFDRLTLAPKTHSGTHSLFHKLVFEGMPFPPGLVAFLKDGFEIKQKVDYALDDDIDALTAQTAVDNAASFLTQAKLTLSQG